MDNNKIWTIIGLNLKFSIKGYKIKVLECEKCCDYLYFVNV